jgi:oligopeptide/dipeptide ABC transporter ATP-binding protein
MAPVPALLEVRNLNIGFPVKGSPVRRPDGQPGAAVPAFSYFLPAVRDLSFCIAPGEVLGLVGESGSGKSVTSLAIMRLLPPQARITGEITFSANDVARDLISLDDNTMRQLRGSLIAMIFQEPMTALNPVMRVGEQIAETVLAHHAISKKEAWQRAVHAMNDVAIPEPVRRARDYPHQLSGGMRQRIMIAMAIVNRPLLLIADEPTTALDVTIQAQILTLLRELVSEENTALILITHDLGVVAGMCERVNVMYAGMFMETGSADQLFERPRHPYTLGLLQSVPRLDAARRTKLQAIEGAPRNMLEPPSACPFQPRCRYEVDLSRQEVPPLVEIEPGHSLACFNPVPAEEWERTRAAATA